MTDPKPKLPCRPSSPRAPCPEPLPCTNHAAVAMGNHVYLWAGRSDETERVRISSTSSSSSSASGEASLKRLSYRTSVESNSSSSIGESSLSSLHLQGSLDSEKPINIFHFLEEKWEARRTTGVSPSNHWGCAYASTGMVAFSFGGVKEGYCCNTVYQLNSIKREWKEIPATNPERAPRGKIGSGIVAIDDHRLVVFAGFAHESKECTNDFHVFDIPTGTWSCPPTSGSRPPPCAFFSMTKITPTKVVLVGGWTGNRKRRLEDIYILDVTNWHWTKVHSKGPKPKPRSHHAACCISGPLCGQEQDHPLLLLVGGVDDDNITLSDAWFLEHVDKGIWREVRFPLDVPRRGHTATAFGKGPGYRQVLLFGGCCDWRGKSIADSTLLTLEFTGQWTIVGVTRSCDFGRPNERIRAKIDRLWPMLEERASTAERHQSESGERARTAEQGVLDAERRLLEADERVKVLEDLLRSHRSDHQPWVVERKEIVLSQERLGKGAWANVWLAEFRGLRVAAKCLHDVIISPHNSDLFVREMNIAAGIRHPNIIQFIGATMHGELIILTELMHTSLRALMEDRSIQQKSLSHGEIITVSQDVARALNYLHLMKPDPIIHRDISSANVLLEPTPNNSWRAKLSDFGSANFSRKLRTAGPGAFIYAPPEANDAKLQSPKMDVYSFGVLLLEMCRCSLCNPDPASRMAAIRQVQYPTLRVTIEQCLLTHPHERPNIGDVLKELTSSPSYVYM